MKRRKYFQRLFFRPTFIVELLKHIFKSRKIAQSKILEREKIVLQNINWASLPFICLAQTKTVCGHNGAKK